MAFRSYSAKEMGSLNKCKSSIERKIREDVLETYPRLEDVIDQFWPKKNDSCSLGKTKSKIQVVCIDNEILFFQKEQGGVWFPTLKLLHRYPSMMPKFRVDKGAIKFVLKGADVM